MRDEQRTAAPWWRRPPFVSLAVALTVWSLFWWGLVDARVIDVAWWLRALSWLGGLGFLAAASRRSDVRWFDPFDSWGARAGDRHPYRGQPADRVKRACVVASLVIGLGGPWLLTSLTESLAVHFALQVHDVVRHHPDVQERRSITRLEQAARDKGGEARIVRIDPQGTAYVTVWDRPAPGTPDPAVPPPPNPGNAACIVIPGAGTARVTDGVCPG